MTPGEMLTTLSIMWSVLVLQYPDAEHDEILKHIEALQLLIFRLNDAL